MPQQQWPAPLSPAAVRPRPMVSVLNMQTQIGSWHGRLVLIAMLGGPKKKRQRRDRLQPRVRPVGRSPGFRHPRNRSPVRAIYILNCFWDRLAGESPTRASFPRRGRDNRKRCLWESRADAVASPAPAMNLGLGLPQAIPCLPRLPWFISGLLQSSRGRRCFNNCFLPFLPRRRHRPLPREPELAVPATGDVGRAKRASPKPAYGTSRRI
jgi:hypothetical protein